MIAITYDDEFAAMEIKKQDQNIVVETSDSGAYVC